MTSAQLFDLAGNEMCEICEMCWLTRRPARQGTARTQSPSGAIAGQVALKVAGELI
jgi:hypothetical protein